MKDQGSGRIKRYEWTAKKPPPPGSNPSENEAIPREMHPQYDPKKDPKKKKKGKKKGA